MFSNIPFSSVPQRRQKAMKTSFPSVTNSDAGTRYIVGLELASAPRALSRAFPCRAVSGQPPEPPRCARSPGSAALVPAESGPCRGRAWHARGRAQRSPSGRALPVRLRPLRRGRCGKQSSIGAMAELPLPAGLNARTFPAKLWRLVNSPRVLSVRWDSQAQGLLIDRSLFERELLSPGGDQGPAPHTFRATRFLSFVRQLYRYGFRKVPGRAGAAAPGDAGAWLHYTNPWFRRDRPELLLRIERRSAASRQRPAAGGDRSRCSRQLPRARPLPDGRERRSRFKALPKERPPLPPRPLPSGFLLLHRERTLPDWRELRRPRPGRFQQPPKERPLLTRRPPCGFHLLHRDRPGPARCEGPSRFQELYGERPLPAERELLRIPPCDLLGLHGERPLFLGREGPPSHFQELYGEQLPPADREVVRIQPCSFQQLHREQQPPAYNPPATPGNSASSAPPGSAACAAASTASAESALKEEESPPLDLGLAVEKMIQEIRRSLSEKSPSAQGNIHVASESSGREPMNEAAAEEDSSGTKNCDDSCPEPEEPDAI
ncbi:uncharacterized protein LOC111941561 [Cyanistes caeruleus]|uniref:uncharacterized protein LOC111941561 n=1 Tax=Cyanistes caeruleus TaxID=156563 RepID=UPI000CDB249E|nr:uncharacterized protein LOC111941561 [Cyanistes caeruleus]